MHQSTVSLILLFYNVADESIVRRGDRPCSIKQKACRDRNKGQATCVPFHAQIIFLLTFYLAVGVKVTNGKAKLKTES